MSWGPMANGCPSWRLSSGVVILYLPLPPVPPSYVDVLRKGLFLHPLSPSLPASGPMAASLALIYALCGHLIFLHYFRVRETEVYTHVGGRKQDAGVGSLPTSGSQGLNSAHPPSWQDLYQLSPACIFEVQELVSHMWVFCVWAAPGTSPFYSKEIWGGGPWGSSDAAFRA